jgi:3,4-dihydroxy-9,10-secoandrosta-1,3,5(10)-triene-9,17-dione 4,5-dioxygenase
MHADERVNALGYLVLGHPQPSEWMGFGQRILGMSCEATGGSDLLLRMDERAWRLAVEEGEPALRAIGLEVGGPEAFTATLDRLSAAGHPWEIDPVLAERRQVAELARFADPDGIPIELYWGALVRRDPFISPRGVRFATAGTGMGHVVLGVGDLDVAYRFYTGLLGFRLSDVLRRAGVEARFLRCNARHHSVAIAWSEVAPLGLQHVMVEVDELDGVGHALLAAEAGDVKVTFGIGRHSNDQMVSFYVQTPNGFPLEYGWGGRLVDERSWTVSVYDDGLAWRPTYGVEPKRIVTRDD